MSDKDKPWPESKYQKKFKKYWGKIPWAEEEEEEDDDPDLALLGEEVTAPVNIHSEYEKYTGKKWVDEEEFDPYISGDELRDHWIKEIMHKVYAHNTSLFRAWVVIVILAVWVGLIQMDLCNSGSSFNWDEISEFERAIIEQELRPIPHPGR